MCVDRFYELLSDPCSRDVLSPHAESPLPITPRSQQPQLYNLATAKLVNGSRSLSYSPSPKIKHAVGVGAFDWRQANRRV